MKAEIKEGKISVNLSEVFMALSDDDKKFLLESFVFEEVIPYIERQLRHETSCDSWNTTGYRDGGKLREAILKTQGIVPEFEKDLKSRIRSLEGDVENYKKYYDWYWKLYHLKSPYSGEETINDYVETKIGKP
jgi:hypothetical protein